MDRRRTNSSSQSGIVVKQKETPTLNHRSQIDNWQAKTMEKEYKPLQDERIFRTKLFPLVTTQVNEFT
jgi:hypothetical protein